MIKRTLNIYTVIPARGGSKSIPKKNIQLLAGKPLIQFSIEYSLKCSLVANTVVSTDSPEISQIARKYGAEVPFLRPAELSQDATPDYPVISHALDMLECLNKEQIDAIVLLRPTSPLRPPGLIEHGVGLLERFPKATSIRSVALSREHPFRQWQIIGDYMVSYEKDAFEPYNIPRQKLPPAYFQTGDLEIIRRETLLEGSVSGKFIIPLIIDHEEMIDIDHEGDFQEAEERLRKRKS